MSLEVNQALSTGRRAALASWLALLFEKQKTEIVKTMKNRMQFFCCYWLSLLLVVVVVMQVLYHQATPPAF